MPVQTHKSTRGNRLRSGFSLVELMVVLVIISILAALILPAVMGGSRTVRIAEVKNEIEKFRTAITQFKVVYGVEPPSSITIHEQASNWSSSPRDRRIIKRIWPQFDFTVDRDVNNMNGANDTIVLDGSECLVAFLGGVTDPSSGAFRGFSKNPRNPFAIDNAQRDGPFFEFEQGRLVDTDADGIPEYMDTLPSQTVPYVYFSSYGGAGYRADNTEDTNLNGTLDNNEDTNGNGVLDERMKRPYYRDSNLSVPYREDSFQIISPGFDAVYGSGGHFDPENPPLSSSGDADNITNFHSSTLGG